MGIEMVDFKHMVWVAERAQYEAIDEIKDKDDVTILNISGTELRRRLAEGLEIPEWFSFPQVVAELRKTKPAAFQARVHRVPHWFLRLWKIHHRQRFDG